MGDKNCMNVIVGKLYEAKHELYSNVNDDIFICINRGEVITIVDLLDLRDRVKMMVLAPNGLFRLSIFKQSIHSALLKVKNQ